MTRSPFALFWIALAWFGLGALAGLLLSGCATSHARAPDDAGRPAFACNGNRITWCEDARADLWTTPDGYDRWVRLCGHCTARD